MKNTMRDWGSVKLVNLTPHPITFLDPEMSSYKNVTPKVLAILDPSGIVARVKFDKIVLGRMDPGLGFPIIITQTIHGEVLNLPDPKPGICYVVSRLVAESIPSSRDDVFTMAGIKRDFKGKIIGGTTLSQIRKQLTDVGN